MQGSPAIIEKFQQEKRVLILSSRIYFPSLQEIFDSLSIHDENLQFLLVSSNEKDYQENQHHSTKKFTVLPPQHHYHLHKYIVSSDVVLCWFENEIEIILCGGGRKNLTLVNHIKKLLKYKIKLIEDAAQSFGSAYNNHKSGAVGVASALSFSPSKPSPTFGFIGAVATDNEALFDHVTDAKKHGVSNGTVGHNSNPASALVLQLQHSLEHHELCQKHRNNLASQYDTGLCDSVVLPHRQGKHNWSKYVIQTEQRDQLKKFLDKQGIETKIHYHRHTIYPTAEKLARTSLSLPIDAWMTNKECKTVCDAIKEFFA